MATSNSLGTLTLDVIANVGAFTGPLDQAARITKKQMKEMGMAVDEFGNYTDKAMKQAIQATKQLDAQFASMAQNVDRELALYGETSRVAKARYDLENTELVKLDAVKKAAYLEDMRRLDAMDSANAAFREQAAAARQLEMQHDQIQETMLAELATYGQVTRAAQLRYRMEHGDLKTLDAAKKASNLKLAEQLDSLDKATQNSMRGIRGVATGFGYQIQDIAVQAQMGTNAMMIFAQQGSQIASLFGPAGAIAGAVIAVGGAIAGGLLPSLFDSVKAADELTKALGNLDNVAVSTKDGVTTLSESIEKLAKSSEIAARAQIVAGLAEAEVAAKKAAASISDAMDEINAGIGVFGVSTFTKPFEKFSQSSDSYLETARELGESFGLVGAKATDAGFKVMNMLRTLREAPTPENFNKLRDSVAELAVSGGTSNKEFLAVVASMNEYFDAATTAEEKTKFLKKAMDDLNGALGTEFGDEYIKKLNEWVKAGRDAAKKAAEDEKSRADSIAKTIAGMEREIALYGVSSKAAQIEYDILSNVLKVKGGLEGVEGRRLMQLAKTQDAMDEQKAAQDEYVAKLKEWVKGERDKEAAVDKIIDGLKKERAELGLNADAYLEVQLRALGAADAKVKEALALAQGNREAAKAAKDAEEMFKRLDEIGANIWTDMLNGTASVFDSIREMFVALLADMAHQAVTKKIMLNIQQTLSGGATSAVQGAATSGVGAGGLYAAGAIAVVAAVNSWNKSQDEKFEKMTAAYRQGVQSTGTLLGMANAKSESIDKSISELEKYADDSLSVNRGMLQALIDIRTGIAGVSAGFARTLGGMSVSGSSSTGSAALGASAVGASVGLYGAAASLSGLAGIGLASGGVGLLALGVAKLIGGDVGEFVESVLGSVGKAIYSKKQDIIDSGIQFGGTTLADIFSEGAIEAFAYADIQTKRKVLGITTSNKVSTEASALDDILLGQFADVFAGAGDALSQAAEVFGLEFDNYINRLIVDPQKLSLKDLEGDALTQAIEAFFSSTLDNWAGVLTYGSGVLEKFQAVGEGAFETVVRLANEVNTFNEYADLLNLNFSAVGFAAIDATQAIADAAGGFDQLASSLSSYYQNFFDEEERAANQMQRLSEALAELGVAKVPETREAFRDMVEQLDLTVAADQELFAALVGLSGVFAELVPVTEALQNNEAELAEARKNAVAEQSRLEQEYFDLTSTEAEKRNLIMANLLSDEARTIQALIFAWQDAQVAAEAALKAAEDARAAEEAANQAQLDRMKELDEYDKELKEKAIQDAIDMLASLKDAASAAMDMVSRSIDAERARIEGIVGGATQAKAVLDDAIGREKDALSKAHDLRVRAIEDAAAAEQAAAQASADAWKSSLQDQTSAVEETIQNLTSLFDSLSSAVEDMALESDDLTRARRRVAEFEIDTAIRNARAGRGLPDADVIQGALGTLQNNPASLYASFEEMAYATAVTQNKLTELAKLTEGQLTEEQARLATLEWQMKAAEATVNMSEKYDAQIEEENARYEAQLVALDVEQENARKQLDKLTGIDTGVITLEEAFVRFNESLLAADFENAQAQLDALDKLEAAAQEQLNALLGVESGIREMNDALRDFGEAVKVANDRINAAGIESAATSALKTNAELLAEVAASREETRELNNVIRQNTQDTADILRQMQEEALTL